MRRRGVRYARAAASRVSVFIFTVMRTPYYAIRRGGVISRAASARAMLLPRYAVKRLSAALACALERCRAARCYARVETHCREQWKISFGKEVQRV